eukprot:4539515-Pleurochrysis_carterae.AAC.2
MKGHSKDIVEVKPKKAIGLTKKAKSAQAKLQGQIASGLPRKHKHRQGKGGCGRVWCLSITDEASKLVEVGGKWDEL